MGNTKYLNYPFRYGKIYRNQGREDKYESNSLSNVVDFTSISPGEYIGDRTTHSTQMLE